MARTRITAEHVAVTPFIVEGSGPYRFVKPASIAVDVTRTHADGHAERGRIVAAILPGFETDGASVPWPFSLLVPRWKPGRPDYNAAPALHDILYIKRGEVAGPLGPVTLSREECDDLLRGIWRCAGMGRFLAGCADKGVEIFAGGASHWGNDGYRVGGFCEVRWLCT